MPGETEEDIVEGWSAHARIEQADAKHAELRENGLQCRGRVRRVHGEFAALGGRRGLGGTEASQHLDRRRAVGRVDEGDLNTLTSD